MDPFIIDLHRTFSNVLHFCRQMLDGVGLLIVIGIVLAAVIGGVLARRRKKVPDTKKYSVSFAPENPHAKRKPYDFERLINKLREIFGAAAVSDKGSLEFGRIDVLRFTVYTRPDGPIDVIAGTAEQLARVYWEMIPVLGRISDEVWTGEMDQGSVLRKMQDMASPHRSA